MEDRTPAPDPAWSLRAARPGDAPLILDSWLRSLHAAPHDLPDDLFNPVYRTLILRVLAASEIRVATPPDDLDLILGYSVSWSGSETQPKVLHWVYVKETYRRAGLAAALTTHLGPRPAHTFRTKATRTFYSRRLGPYRPNLLLRLRPSK